MYVKTHLVLIKCTGFTGTDVYAVPKFPNPNIILQDLHSVILQEYPEWM